jgi:hypothetical protein
VHSEENRSFKDLKTTAQHKQKEEKSDLKQSPVRDAKNAPAAALTAAIVVGVVDPLLLTHTRKALRQPRVLVLK